MDLLMDFYSMSYNISWLISTLKTDTKNACKGGYFYMDALTKNLQTGCGSTVWNSAQASSKTGEKSESIARLRARQWNSGFKENIKDREPKKAVIEWN
jgi:hypothetical protein